VVSEVDAVVSVEAEVVTQMETDTVVEETDMMTLLHVVIDTVVLVVTDMAEIDLLVLHLEADIVLLLETAVLQIALMIALQDSVAEVVEGVVMVPLVVPLLGMIFEIVKVLIAEIQTSVDEVAKVVMVVVVTIQEMVEIHMKVACVVVEVAVVVVLVEALLLEGLMEVRLPLVEVVDMVVPHHAEEDPVTEAPHHVEVVMVVEETEDHLQLVTDMTVIGPEVVVHHVTKTENRTNKMHRSFQGNISCLNTTTYC